MSSTHVRSGPSSRCLPLPCPHCHLGSDANGLPTHKEPASHELLYETQTSRSQTLEEKDQPDLPTDCKSTGVSSTICCHCCFCFSPWPFGAPGPKDASGQLVVMPTQTMVQVPAQQPLSCERWCPHSLYCKSSSWCLFLSVQVLGPFTPVAENHSPHGYGQGNQVRNRFRSPSRETKTIVYFIFLPKGSIATHPASIISFFFLLFKSFL